MKYKHLFIKILAILLTVIVLAYVTFLVITQPSNSRDWSKDMSEISSATIDGNKVVLHNIRNAQYKNVLDYDLKYHDETFYLNTIEKAYLFVDPFGAYSAHTMLGFEWSDGKRVVLSVEVRREKNEWFSGWKGLFRKFEIIYVWADETDVIKLRTNIRKDSVYMYELDMAQENIAKLFIDAINRTNQLATQPEFYNTITNNCTTNLINHLQRVYDKSFVLDWRYYVPGYTDELGMKYGLIPEKVNLLELRKNHNISPAAISCGDCTDYSKKIHGE
jgi:hypothetical protein